MVEAVIFIGMQASGKSSFFKERFFDTHIRSMIGWTIDQRELLAQPGEAGRWLIVAQRVEQEDQLRV